MSLPDSKELLKLGIATLRQAQDCFDRGGHAVLGAHVETVIGLALVLNRLDAVDVEEEGDLSVGPPTAVLSGGPSTTH